MEASAGGKRLRSSLPSPLAILRLICLRATCRGPGGHDPTTYRHRLLAPLPPDYSSPSDRQGCSPGCGLLPPCLSLTLHPGNLVRREKPGAIWRDPLDLDRIPPVFAELVNTGT